MASSEAYSRLSQLLIPALEKIIKNGSWRKHSKLAHECKAVIENLSAPDHNPTSPSNQSVHETSPSHPGVLLDLPLYDSELILSPFINAATSGNLKIVEPAIDAVQKLIAYGYLHGEADSTAGPDCKLLAKVIESICSCHALGDESVELLVIKTVLSSVTSGSLRIHGDSLLLTVRTCYDIYLGSKNVVNQTTAKASLVQMLVIVFRRMEADSSTVPLQPIVLAELMEPVEKVDADGSVSLFVQGFITKIIHDIDGVLNQGTPRSGIVSSGAHDGAFETASTVESTNPADLLDSTDKDMLDAKYWEISMYKTALEGRKGELDDGEVERDDDLEVQIGNKLRRDAFLVFRALCKLSMKSPPKEALADPELMRGKIVALELLKILLENAGAIFRTSERMVNGLLKTAQGVPPGVATTLLPPQEATMKLEAMKCLVAILKSMGDWVNKQLRIPDPQSTKKSEIRDNSYEPGSMPMENGNGYDPVETSDSHSEASNEVSDASAIEQRRAYKLELQEGISLFNRKPKKGIEFLLNANKVGNSPDDIAVFLKNSSGLSKTMIGDYLGEREDLSLKVMHAYVDSFDFQDLQFDEAIRAFLQGFRLPGEAQKIDRIMEKFAERYCKCNPRAFASADTAYILAYSVILLNTDAHNPMVKNKMSADDFIRNNRGIDDGKDLPEEDMRSLYDRISKNEIKMKEDDFTMQQIQSVNSNRILDLDNILNIVIRKPGEDSQMETGDDLMRHMQEQFKEKARKSESLYYAATDVMILRFMIEVCWAPMLAAFSVPLDQSDDEVIIAQCLDGFRSAIHVTAAMSMKTHRDAFVTSLAKFTSLHSPADIKQKNIDAINAIVTIADEEGNHLKEAWEHILTCVSRFEHLHLLGEGAPPDATFFAIRQNELQKPKQAKSNMLPLLKKKGAGKIQNAASAVRRGSYDSAGIGGNISAAITSEQMNNLVSNLNMLEQVGEMSHIFIRSQKLNSEAIVDFVKALCKVSMEELRSPTDPRVFSLTKIVEIAHYNMNRIRYVWSKIWHVLSDFFVTIGCSENLSISIFAMDSLRQLSMKFLDREELANYNFQNEFMKPFVIVMRKSSAVEIRELIIRCVSQMVLSRVSNVKSGWKSMFMVFTAAASDNHKNIVLLAFEIIEKIVRDYFPYITETETTTFTDCVNCLIAFTNNKLNEDLSLNAIGFLHLCAVKLAEGEVSSASRKNDKEAPGKVSLPSPGRGKDKRYGNEDLPDTEDHLYFFLPLLAGLSELSFDPRPEIRRRAFQVLFDTLRDYGHHFSLPLWERVFESVLLPIFDNVQRGIYSSGEESQEHRTNGVMNELDQDAWLYETCTLALQLVVDLFVKFYDTVNPILRKVMMLLVNLIKRPYQSLAGIGIAALVRLMSNAGELFPEDKWFEVVLTLKEAANATLPDFSFVSCEEAKDWVREEEFSKQSNKEYAEVVPPYNDLEASRNKLYIAISDAKSRAAVQLLLIQAVMEIYHMHRHLFSVKNTIILFDGVHAVAFHAHRINNDAPMCAKLQELASITQLQDPPLFRLENESYQICLTLLQNLALAKPPNYEELEVETYLVNLCREVLQFYIESARSVQLSESSNGGGPHWLIPLGSGRQRELAGRAPLVVETLQTICSLGDSSFEKHLSRFFPLLSSLISCEHGSNEVQLALSDMLRSSVGPVLLRSC